MQVPTAAVEIADPKCSVSEGVPEGKTKEVKRLIGDPGSANVSVRGINVYCSERDGGLECANLSNPLPPTAIWITNSRAHSCHMIMKFRIAQTSLLLAQRIVAVKPLEAASVLPA